MSKLEQVLEQTKFLLETQEKAKKECSDIFSSFLASINQKAKSCKSPEDVRSLEKIHELISSQAEDFDDEMQDDIDFLEEQKTALEQVKDVKDEAKAEEILSMIIDEEEEILDTEEFKRKVTEDDKVSKQNLLGMIEDLNEALNEGSVKEVEMLLESFAFDGDDECGCGDCESCDECDDFDDEDDEDDYEDEDDCEEEESSCCSGAKKCNCGDRCGKNEKAVDILAEFNKLAEHVDDKNKKKK